MENDINILGVRISRGEFTFYDFVSITSRFESVVENIGFNFNTCSVNGNLHSMVTH